MSSRKELGDTLRELVRQISSVDPANRKLGLIEQLMNAMISDFAALTVAVAELVQDSNVKIQHLQQQLEAMQEDRFKSGLLKRTELPTADKD